MTENNRPTPPTTKKSFSVAMNWVTCVLFTLLLCIPLLLLVTTGQDKTVMEGEKQHEVPSFSASDFVSAEFQSNFELWFSTKYPLRGRFVTAYRQLQFDTSNIGFDISTLFVPKAPIAVNPAETTPATPSVDTLETTADGGTVAPVEEPEPTSPYSDFNSLYATINKRLYERTPVELTGYKGTDQVIIGKSGYCYENGYINELLGYSQKYRDCPDSWIEDRVEKMTYIQARLAEQGIAFTFIITPSKAGEYPQYVPDWYKAQNKAPENYVRPVDKLRAALAESDIHYVDCAALYDEVGLDETFPLTGIHWNKPASYEATRALMLKYEEQTGENVRNIIASRVKSQKNPSGFGNPEQDIFNIAYSGLSTKNAIVDDFYYVPELKTEDEEEGARINMLIQGGSFCGDFDHYMQTYKLTKQYLRFYYNGFQGASAMNPRDKGNGAWERILRNIDYVIFECNEQFVTQMGTDAPRWGNADKQPFDPDTCWDVYESLYDYLKSTEGAAE